MIPGDRHFRPQEDPSPEGASLARVRLTAPASSSLRPISMARPPPLPRASVNQEVMPVHVQPGEIWMTYELKRAGQAYSAFFLEPDRTGRRKNLTESSPRASASFPMISSPTGHCPPGSRGPVHSGIMAGCFETASFDGRSPKVGRKKVAEVHVLANQSVA